MAELNEKAKKVFALKYSTGKTKTWRETCRKIADFIAEGERPYGATDDQIKEIADKYYEFLYELYMLPGGRIIANAGTGIKNLANCFVLGIEDSRQSIYQTLKDAAEIFAMGGGVGYNFSHVREEGAPINSTDGKASGPLSFMSLFDQTGEVIQQASRRGAQLGALNISHPDSEKFIGFKSTLNSRNDRLMKEYDRNLHVVNGVLNGTKYAKILEKTLLDDQLTHFNISVMLTDKFMQAVENDEDWDFISPSTNKVVKTVKAKELLMRMAEQAWESGDPGTLQYDRINEDNLVPYIGNIEATNPCGEVPLLSGESCILTSINLHEMYDKKTKEINWDLLKDVVKTATRFLENVTEITEAPLPFINETTKGLRRLGLGVLGWADLLVELNIPYDSVEAIEVAEKLSWFINFHAWETSFELAKERGPFSFFDKDLINWNVVDKTLYDEYFGESTIHPEELHRIGVRNVACGSIAPTGSIAIIGGVNSSIEPFFALAYRRNITEGVGNIATDSIYETNPALQRKLKEFGYNDEETKSKILDYAATNGTLTGCDLVSEEFQSIFKTANEISWQKHIDMQAAWQKYFSNAISKTVNIPEEATVQDIYNIYLYMWKSGLKGGTIYRNNSKTFQILEKPAKKD
jgi:ribonucleoside-diphosphate reductase alpha chain